MSTSEARILANKANAARSTGPKTEEGKARSRANAVKHGLTGAGIALPVGDAAEVDRLQHSYEAELKPSGEVGRMLVRRMALMTVRMDRCVDQETAHLNDRVRQAEADFDAEWPEVEGEGDPFRQRMRVETAQRAMFDPSRDATLARKYEAAAERCFFRSLKELRVVEKTAKASVSSPELDQARSALGSFLPAETMKPAPAPQAQKSVTTPSKPLPKPVPTFPVAPKMPPGGSFSEVPFAIGRVG